MMGDSVRTHYTYTYTYTYFECPGYDTKLHLMMRLQILELCRIPSLPLLPGQLWPEIVVLVWAPSMCQTDLFKNYSNSTGLCAKGISETTQKSKV